MRQGLVALAAFVFLCHVAQGGVGEGGLRNVSEFSCDSRRFFFPL